MCKKSSFGSNLIASLLGLALFMFWSAFSVQAATILKVATHSSAPGTPRADYLVRFAKSVDERTRGEVKVQVFWANSLVHAKEALEAVQVGTADMADLAVSYFADKLKLLQVATLPFSVSDPVEQYNGVLRMVDQIPEVRKEWERLGHVLVAATATASYQLPSREPIRNLAELKGKKVGTFGRVVPRVIQAVEAVPVSVSAGEMYEALQRGTIDARVLSYESSKRFRLYEVAKYISEINLGALAGINLLTVNRSRWEGLSPAHQKILLEVGKEVGEWEAKAMKEGETGFQEFLKSHGMTVIKFPPEDLKRWQNLPEVKKIAEDWVAQMEKQQLPGKRALAIFLGR